MTKLVITRYRDKILQAFVDDGKVMELSVSDESCVLGNIYIGRIANVVENIHACFVDYGDKLPCYYSLDDGEVIYADGKQHEKPKAGDEILVQISREAVKTKNPVGTSELTLKGDYCLVHMGSQIGVSNKISDNETRERLKALARSILPEGTGCIIRTNANEADDEVIACELNRLSGRLSQILKSKATRKCYSCLYRTPPEYLENITFFGRSRIDECVTDDAAIYDELKGFMEGREQQDAGAATPALTLHDDGSCPLTAVYNLAREIEGALKERVWLKSGGYLVIQQTEAMVVIDVNTGKAVSGKNMDEHLLKINTDAAVESCRQLRLRNLSGIVVIDFINMKRNDDIYKLRDILIRELAKDSVPAKFVDITKLGLVELTRKKIRKPLHEELAKLGKDKT